MYNNVIYRYRQLSVGRIDAVTALYEVYKYNLYPFVCTHGMFLLSARQPDAKPRAEEKKILRAARDCCISKLPNS